MKQTKLSRVLSPLFEWDLACNKHADIKSMLKELKQKARDLQHRASATHDPRSQRAIIQKQQIIHTYRCKPLTLLRECQLRRQKI